MRAPRVAALVLLSAAMSAVPAVRAAGQGAEAGSADAFAKEARAHYDQGRFEQAVASYLKAFRLAPSAGFLYNVAVIYDRKLNEPELAIDFYRRYIKAEDADPAVVERATARIKALKSQSPPEPILAPTAPPTAAPEPVASQPPPPPPAPPPAGLTTRDVAGYTLLSIGGLSLVGGGVLGVLAYTVHGKYQDAENISDKKNLQSLGRSEALTGDILMGVGAVMAGTGLYLLLTGGDEASPAPTPALEAGPDVSLVPLPGGLGLTFGGSL